MLQITTYSVIGWHKYHFDIERLLVLTEMWHAHAILGSLTGRSPKSSCPISVETYLHKNDNRWLHSRRSQPGNRLLFP